MFRAEHYNSQNHADHRCVVINGIIYRPIFRVSDEGTERAAQNIKIIAKKFLALFPKVFYDGKVIA